MCRGKARVQVHGPTVADYGLIQISLLVGEHAEQMDSIRVVGLALENLAVDLFGYPQPARLMVLDSQCKGLRSRGHPTQRASRFPA